MGEEKARRRNREKRSIRQRLKNLAATKIQALAKGFLVRRTGVRQYFKQLSFIESKKEDERMRNNKTKLKLLSKMRKAIKKSMKRANKYITYSEQDQNLLNVNSGEGTYEYKHPHHSAQSIIRIQAIVRGWLGRLRYEIVTLENRMNQIEKETNERIMNVKLRTQHEKVSYWEKVNGSHKDEESKKGAIADKEIDLIETLTIKNK